MVLQAQAQILLIEAFSVPNMKRKEADRVMERYAKIINPEAKSGTIDDRERLKRILKRK